MWKFPGQGSNLRHSCDPGHCRDDTGSFSQPLYHKGTPRVFFCWSFVILLLNQLYQFFGFWYFSKKFVRIISITRPFSVMRVAKFFMVGWSFDFVMILLLYTHLKIFYRTSRRGAMVNKSN